MEFDVKMKLHVIPGFVNDSERIAKDLDSVIRNTLRHGVTELNVREIKYPVGGLRPVPQEKPHVSQAGRLALESILLQLKMRLNHPAWLTNAEMDQLAKQIAKLEAALGEESNHARLGRMRCKLCETVLTCDCGAYPTL